jgi:hypothetical protein
MDVNIPEEESPHTLNNLDPKVFGLTVDKSQERISQLIKYLNFLRDSHAIENLNKRTTDVEKWMSNNVFQHVGVYDYKNPEIKRVYDELVVQKTNHLAQKAGGSKRRKSTRIFRKSIRKCKKCKRNYRKSKKSKQV